MLLIVEKVVLLHPQGYKTCADSKKVNNNITIRKEEKK